MSSPLRESVQLQMRLRGFAASTHEAYLHALRDLARFHRRPLDTLSCAEVQAFLDDLITVRHLAWATVNVYFSACRFLAHILPDGFHKIRTYGWMSTAHRAPGPTASGSRKQSAPPPIHPRSPTYTP